jgi:hypothetical protein
VCIVTARVAQIAIFEIVALMTKNKTLGSMRKRISP